MTSHARFFPVLLLAMAAAPVLAQDAPTPDRSQDMGWHMAQQQALASRRLSRSAG